MSFVYAFSNSDFPEDFFAKHEIINNLMTGSFTDMEKLEIISEAFVDIFRLVGIADKDFTKYLNKLSNFYHGPFPDEFQEFYENLKQDDI